MSAASPNRAGVIDIGSNSVRLVAFDLRPGLPLPAYNEKVVCRLAEGVARSGRLADGNMRLALASLGRFATLTRALELEPVYPMATAAVREAANAGEFVAAAEAVLGVPVAVLSGEEEARLSAQGVLAGFQGADGIAADLGGGSLELAEIGDGRIGRRVSLGLGPIRVADLVGSNLGKARAEIDRQLATIDWPAESKGRTLYLVGGAWRALARIEMARTEYPLAMVHGYALAKADARALAARVARAAPAKLAALPGVPRRRVDSLPFAALLLGRLLEACLPRQVSFSAQGLREGLVRDRLATTAWATDPLFTAAGWMAGQSDMSTALSALLARWTAPLFADEDEGDERLRRVACELSDVACREHPEYRAEQALGAILRVPVLPLGHADRAYLGLAVWHRHAGPRPPPAAVPVRPLLTKAVARRATILGLALRIAYRLSGGAVGLLEQTALEVEGGRLRLRLSSSFDPGHGVERRLANLAREAALEPLVETV